MSQSPPLHLARLAEIAGRYDAVLSDVWGVIHNGVAAFPEACDALASIRASSGSVVLISNAPRPRQVVMRHLQSLGVPRATYDDIVTSGDVAQHYIASRAGAKVFHIGPERDLANFDGVDVHLAPLQSCDYVVCTGLFDDDVETAEDYRDLLLKLRGRDLFMVCANPDLVVERGDRLVYCAGAIADLYAELGGQVMYTGKPHRPIYEEALAKVHAIRGEAPPLTRVLAIGDSVRTDIAGAAAMGIDCLFVTGGIHAEEIGGSSEPNLLALERLFSEAGAHPVAVMRRLNW